MSRSGGPGSGGNLMSRSNSTEKPYECFDLAQHERKISNDFSRSSVRPNEQLGVLSDMRVSLLATRSLKIFSVYPQTCEPWMDSPGAAGK